MTIDQADSFITTTTVSMENSVDSLVNVAELTQAAIFEYLNSKIFEFDTVSGRLVRTQPLARKFAEIERGIFDRIDSLYNKELPNYFNVYDIVDERNVTLQKELNNITLAANDIKNVRETVYKQAEYFLKEAVAEAYVQPIKYALMQTVSEGKSIKEAQSLLKNWNDGELVSGTISAGRPTPRLQAYAGQMARDSLFQYNGNVQKNVQDKYALNSFLYVGGLVKTSRPLCRHLVALRRKIKLDEIPQLLLKYPEGTYPDTTKANFMVYRGGFNCLHNAVAVRD